MTTAKQSASKGLKKRHSTLQKDHYKAHHFKLSGNKIERLKRHIKRNALEIEKKAARKHPRVINVDQQAINRLKALTA